MVDNREGGLRLGRYLTDLGHRDIALISGPSELLSSVERLEGLRSAFDEVGARLSVHHGPPTRDEGYRAVGELLARKPELTAVLGTADQMAIGAMSALRDGGYSIPGDVSVAGFNDISISRDLSPSLTTVRLPLREMGRWALEIALTSDPEQSDKRGYVERRLGVELMVRESTGPARGQN